MKLIDEIALLTFTDFTTVEIGNKFVTFAESGSIIMDDNPHHHICVYTLPYHAEGKQVLLGHHRKADKWLVPGGHIDTGETIAETAVREIQEEMGIVVDQSAISGPFYAEITNITSKPPRYCTMHYSFWMSFSAPSNKLVLDPGEFFECKWFSLEEAIEKTSDQGNKDALARFARSIKY